MVVQILGFSEGQNVIATQKLIRVHEKISSSNAIDYSWRSDRKLSTRLAGKFCRILNLIFGLKGKTLKTSQVYISSHQFYTSPALHTVYIIVLRADYMASFSPGWNSVAITWRVAARAEISARPPGWKFCCDYMASFSPGRNLKLRWKVGGRHLVSLKTQSLSKLKLTFQPGLKFNCDYMRFLWISARAENPSPVSQTGLEISTRAEIQLGLTFSPCNRKRLFKKICSGGRGEISAWLTGLKFQPAHRGLKFCCDYMASFSPGWNLKLRWKVGDRYLVSLKTQSLSKLKLTFQPGLKFWCDYMRFFWISARAENPSPVSQTGLEISARAEIQPGLKFSPCNRKRLFKKICSGGRGEISARLTGLKFQPGLKFAM